MRKDSAELLGWTFTVEQEERLERTVDGGALDVPGRYIAVKRVAETMLEKEHDTLEKLLNDIKQWEVVQEARSAAPARRRR